LYGGIENKKDTIKETKKYSEMMDSGPSVFKRLSSPISQ
jgi:hypothetical protein